MTEWTATVSRVEAIYRRGPLRRAAQAIAAAHPWAVDYLEQAPFLVGPAWGPCSARVERAFAMACERREKLRDLADEVCEIAWGIPSGRAMGLRPFKGDALSTTFGP